MLAAGVGIGALIAPGGTAAEERDGLGFLAAPGWHVYQAGGRASVARPSYAIAANIPLDPQDFIQGSPTSLPYATLLSLPRNGVVMVADISLAHEHGPAYPLSPRFRPRTLPLSLEDSESADWLATQVRPERPLGQHNLRAAVSGYAIDLRVYFGSPRPSAALMAAAQRQLDRLVVDPAGAAAQPAAPAREPAARPAVNAVAQASRTFDRTFRCNLPLHYGGVPKLELTVMSGLRSGRTFERIATATITARTVSPLGRRADDGYLHVGGVSAGWPPKPPLTSGGIAIGLDRCTATRGRPALIARGLSGGLADTFGDGYECLPPKTVLLRTRVLFHRPTTVRTERSRDGSRSLIALARITRASWVLQTLKGKRIAYADVLESGRARMFTAPFWCSLG